MIYDGSLSVNSILNMGDTGRWIACIVIGALIVLWILVGISNLGKLNTIAMAALFILTIVMCFFIFGNGNGMGAAGDDSMSFGAAVELSVAMPLSWLPLISDYTKRGGKAVQGNSRKHTCLRCGKLLDVHNRNECIYSYRRKRYCKNHA